MKHIGIVDVTTIGACICANAIVAKAAEHDSSGHHPEFSLHSFSFKQYKDAVSKEDWRAVAALILASIEKLKAAGADFVIIPSNTPHYAYDAIVAKSPLPVLSIIDLTVEACLKAGCKTALITGTKQTMTGGLYADKLKQAGIRPLVPNAELQDAIHSLIFDEIIPSKIKAESVEEVRRGIQAISFDAVILGCTELPEVYNSENIGKLAIDTTRLLAHEALSFAMGKSLSGAADSGVAANAASVSSRSRL